MSFDLELAISLLPDLFEGALVTLFLVPIIILFGGLLAVITGTAMASGHRVAAPVATGFSVFFRGAPALVVLYMIYNGLPQVSLIRDTFLWSFFRDPINCAIVALAFNHAAFLSEAWRGALLGLPPGLRDAASALGLSRPAAYATVFLPLAFRAAYSAYRNEIVFMIKTTSIVGAITVTDLLDAARKAVSDTYDPTTPLLMAALFYWCIVNTARLMMDWLETALRRHEVH